MTAPRVVPRPIGWPLLPLPDGHGRLAYPTQEDSVREMIEVILRTRPGEQVMRPEFGAGLDGFLHQPNTPDTRRRIRELVASAIVRWESRLLLDRVEVEEVSGSPAHVRVEIAYRLRRTGLPQKLGLTMDLGG
jgi:uncharacterized protein